MYLNNSMSQQKISIDTDTTTTAANSLWSVPSIKSYQHMVSFSELWFQQAVQVIWQRAASLCAQIMQLQMFTTIKRLIFKVSKSLNWQWHITNAVALWWHHQDVNWAHNNSFCRPKASENIVFKSVTDWTGLDCKQCAWRHHENTLNQDVHSAACKSCNCWQREYV